MISADLSGDDDDVFLSAQPEDKSASRNNEEDPSLRALYESLEVQLLNLRSHTDEND